MNLFFKSIVCVTLVFLIGLAKAENHAQNQTHHLSNDTQEENCTPAAIYEFPSDGFTREQRRAGWVTIHVLLTCYCFIILSIVCDDHFVPGIQTLVKKLQLSEDVAGASFMAITSASPELFINCVGTFITEGDLGVGTVVGSNVFNILAAPACCGLFARMAFQFECYSIMRDGLMYGVSVMMLIATLYDDKVYWYEALAFVLAYIIYIGAMYFDKTIQKKTRACIIKPKRGRESCELEKLHGITETYVVTKIGNHDLSKPDSKLINHQLTETENLPDVKIDNEKEEMIGNEEDPKEQLLWIFPKEEALYKKLWWIIIWPIVFTLSYTVPNCKKRPGLYPFTLLMCMFWIGTTSYLLAWLITAIGDTISIPDSVMGLSFLAVGSSMPEIVSCIIVSKQGQGIMGMSSALGANTFEVLLCLGLPWLIKTCFYPKTKGSHWIDINSSGLAYNATCLLSTLVFLYICLICNRFRLDWKVGLICLIMYGVFLVVGTLIELNFFFVVNLPTCL